MPIALWVIIGLLVNVVQKQEQFDKQKKEEVQNETNRK